MISPTVLNTPTVLSTPYGTADIIQGDYKLVGIYLEEGSWKQLALMVLSTLFLYKTNIL